MTRLLLLLIAVSNYTTFAQTDAYQFSADIVDEIEAQIVGQLDSVKV